MKHSQYQSTGTAAKMMCPFKLAQKRPVKSIIYLAVGLLVIAVDCVFSKHILSISAANETVFVILLAVSGFSVLKDVVSIKKSFSTSHAFVLLRFSSIATSMLFTAAALYAIPFFVKYQVYIVLFCSVFRLFTPSAKHFYLPLLFSLAALVIVIIIIKTVCGEINTAEVDLSRIYPACSAIIQRIKDFIVLRW